jgi:hypothetical protein
VIERYGTYNAPIGNCQERLTTTPASPYTFRADFNAWSPDGRYFAPDAGFEGLIQPPAAPRPDPQALSDLQLTQEVNLPVRDAALERALNNLGNIRRIVMALTAQSEAAQEQRTFSLTSSVRPRNL